MIGHFLPTWYVWPISRQACASRRRAGSLRTALRRPWIRRWRGCGLGC